MSLIDLKNEWKDYILHTADVTAINQVLFHTTEFFLEKINILNEEIEKLKNARQ